METKDTKTKQHHWWPAGETHVYHYTPPYDKQSTQRTDFQKPACELSLPTIFSSQQRPSCGIAPLAAPRTSKGLPKILQEQTSVSHQYNARESPSEPIQGKRHGAFVCTEIKPASGSCSPEQPKTEKENSVKSRMTSTLSSETHLSKPDIREIAKAYPRIPVRGHKSSGISQTTEVDLLYLISFPPLLSSEPEFTWNAGTE
uniref:Chromosome 2 open reading frame 73 n=1 Tax=Dromaius novaehollandiae TaxID=8790 RepID=A0A8C4JH14_DRONO